MANAEQSNLSRWVFNASLPDVFVDLRVNVEFLVFSHFQVADDLFSNDLHGARGALVSCNVPRITQGNDQFGFIWTCHSSHLIAATYCVAIGVA